VLLDPLLGRTGHGYHALIEVYEGWENPEKKKKNA
jgi:hypothetical protein